MSEDIRLTEIKMNARTHDHVNKMLAEKDAEIARLKERLSFRGKITSGVFCDNCADWEQMAWEEHQKNADLNEALDCATNNQWSEWELKRGEVEGESMAQAFKIMELEKESATLKEKMNGIMKELVAAAPPYYRKWQDAMKENAALREKVIDLAKRLRFCMSDDGRIGIPTLEDIDIASQILTEK